MTNEELIRRFYDGEDTTGVLYCKNEGLIIDIAKKVATAYNCLQHKENTKSLTDYSKQIIEELKQEGAVEFFRLLRLKEYDETCSKFTTYIYPYIQGVMRRWMEANYAEYTAHVISIYDLVPDVESGDDPFEYITTDEGALSVDQTVYRKICVELLEELFLSLPEKDRCILGESMGVFGFAKQPLDRIALKEEMTVDGVIKARQSAIRKLKESYLNSKLHLWRDVHRTVIQYLDKE